MKVSDLGKRTASTPPYELTEEKKAKQQYETSISKVKKFKDSQDLVDGPQYAPTFVGSAYLGEISPSDKGFRAKKAIEQIAMKSEGRYHL